MKAFKSNTLVLAGDVGGTKTNLGLYKLENEWPVAKIVESYESGKEPGLENIITSFIERHPADIAGACFGVAGPVISGQCKTTNLPWNISEKRLKKIFRWKKLKLVNDLEAMAYGISSLRGRDLFPLNNKRIRKDRNFGLIAPGTGLGQVLGIWTDGKYVIVPSEGGHSDFSPNNHNESLLWKYLHRHYGHVSIERVLSGHGLYNIYKWLKESGKHKAPKWLEVIIKSVDPAVAITEAAIKKKTPICLKTLDTFVSILGASAGNLVLTGMTLGGLYLGGGIPPKILPTLREGRFMESFVNKGRFASMMEGIAVRVILNERTPLAGAANCAFEMITEQPAQWDKKPPLYLD